MAHRIKYTLAVLGIILAALSIVYGEYLPLTKARGYINAIRQLQSIRSLTEFKKVYDTVFTLYSPVGDEEVAKFAAYDILGVISRQGQPEVVSRGLVEYIEPYMLKNNVRHLLALGQMYETLWKMYGKDSDFEKAEKYYRQALAIGPKLPPVLYSLMQLYQETSDQVKFGEIANLILKYWPSAANPPATSTVSQ